MKGIKSKENNFQVNSTNLTFFITGLCALFPKTLFGLGVLQNVALFKAKVALP